jgi:uncharacterized phage protein gp47/JayE
VADLASFAPLRQETIDTIRARIDANVNAGLDPADPRWQDTTAGGFFFEHTQSMGMEAEFLWDFASVELVASFFLPRSWGIYLDYWGELLEVPRKPAAEATGEVTFTNTSVSPISVPSGTQVAAPSTDPDEDPLIYETTVTDTLPGSGTVTIPLIATATGSAYSVPADAVSQVLNLPSGQVTVTNDDPITGGADVELDEPYKARLLLEFGDARGGGTIADYVAGTLKDPSVGRVVVQPVWAGPGTVRIIISDINNDPLGADVIARVQAYWDPVPGNGEGEAPINATVTVATVTAVTVNVVATVVSESGFTPDGAGGTEATGDAITEAIRAYIDSLAAGADVQHNRVLKAILSVRGVYDVATLTLNASPTADVAIGVTEAAQLGTVGVTEAP